MKSFEVTIMVPVTRQVVALDEFDAQVRVKVPDGGRILSVELSEEGHLYRSGDGTAAVREGFSL